MPKQVDKYGEERGQVLNQIFEILGINEQNNMFSLHKMDENVVKQGQILGLEDDIKKYFLCGEWSCFKKKENVKRRWLSMIKYVVKDMGYQIFISEKNVLVDGQVDRDKNYHIIKV